MSIFENTTAIPQEQRALLLHIDRNVRRVRSAMRYHGVQKDDDLSAMVIERLIRREPYRSWFLSDPLKLRGLIGIVTRQVVLEALRAERRKPVESVDYERMPSTRDDHALCELLVSIRAKIGSASRVRGVRRPGPTPYPRSQRALHAFWLHVLEGKTHREISRELGVPKSTVGSWVQSIRQMIGAELRP